MIDKKLLTLLLPSQLRFEPDSAFSTVLEEQYLSEVSKMNIQSLKTSVLKFVKDEDGLTVVEYAVAGGLISLFVVAAFRALGLQVAAVISAITLAITP